MKQVVPFFECPHCFKKLTTEARLEKHSCEKKKRFLHLQTPKGQSAFFCYKTWLNKAGRKCKDQDQFMNSKFYNSFLEFVKFCNKVGLPDRKHFIQYAIDEAIPPTLWTNMEVYNAYIIHFDTSKTPIQMAEITVDTMFDLAQIFDCDVTEVFEHMYSSDIMKLVIARKLSPWILLFSKGFMQHMRTETTPEQRLMINTVIDHKHWLHKFKENPEMVSVMKKVVSELKI